MQHQADPYAGSNTYGALTEAETMGQYLGSGIQHITNGCSGVCNVTGIIICYMTRNVHKQ